MRAEDVAQYLQDNPQFFADHAEMLSQINLPHPHGGRTISLSERQLFTLRERVKELEKKLHELLQFAKENDALQLKVHQFNCALFGPHDRATLQSLIVHNLRDIFAVPHVALHCGKTSLPARRSWRLPTSMRSRYVPITWYTTPCSGSARRGLICVRSPICRCARAARP